MTPDSGSGPLAPDLRSMLSRAVESELGEQRELTDAIGQIRVQLTRLNDEVGGLRARTIPEGASSAQVNTMTVELREAVRVLSDRLDRVTKVVSERSEDLTEIRTGLTVLDAHVRSQAETLGSLSASLQALPAYSDRVSVLQDNLQVLHRQLVGIEASLSAAEASPIADRLSSIEATLGTVGLGNGGLVAGHAEALDKRLEAIEAAIGAAGSAPQVDDGAVDERLAAIETLAADLKSQIDPIAVDITAIGSEVAGLAEASADNGVLDRRISEVVSHAVEESEQRLKQHVDEAVLALAQTLLKRRAVVGAGGPTEAPDADDAIFADESAEDDPVDVHVDAEAAAEDEAEDETVDASDNDEAAEPSELEVEPEEPAAWTAEVETDFWATPAPLSLNGMSNGVSPPTSLSAYRAELADERSELTAGAPTEGDGWASPADEAHDTAVTTFGADHGRRRKRRFGRD